MTNLDHLHTAEQVLTADRRSMLAHVVEDAREELIELRAKLDQILVDPNYEGGVQYRNRKHDAIWSSRCRWAWVGIRVESMEKAWPILLTADRI